SLKEEVPDFVSNLDSGVQGLRVGWSRDLGYAAVDPEVVEIASERARRFEELGCTVEEVDVGLENPWLSFWTVFSSSAYSAYGYLLDEHAPELTSYARYSMEHGKHQTAADYGRALHVVHLLQVKFRELMEKYDLIMTPTMATTAFPIHRRPEKIAGKKVDPMFGYLPFTFPINMIGQPASSVPCGFSADGMPVGLHIIGRTGDEATVLRASAAFEKAHPWADKRASVS
ncbi:MAG: amidase, partial [Dehalococcoidia bacterium]